MNKFICKLKDGRFLIAMLAILLICGMIRAYRVWFSTTHIAFLNYQVIALGQLSHANTNDMIKLCEITTDDFDHLDAYDMIGLLKYKSKS